MQQHAAVQREDAAFSIPMLPALLSVRSALFILQQNLHAVFFFPFFRLFCHIVASSQRPSALCQHFSARIKCYADTVSELGSVGLSASRTLLF